MQFIFRGMLRIAPLAHIFTFAFFDLFITTGPGAADDIMPWAPEALLVTAIWYALMLRVGVLATGAAFFFNQALMAIPLTLEMHVWYAGRTLVAFTLFAALLIYEF